MSFFLLFLDLVVEIRIAYLHVCLNKVIRFAGKIKFGILDFF